ncbi:hypothetical protein [Undibacterium sp. TC9W]
MDIARCMLPDSTVVAEAVILLPTGFAACSLVGFDEYSNMRRIS